MHKKEYISAIMRSPDGALILQLRDDNPKIADPGCVSLFAGAVEEGETNITVDHAGYLFSYELPTETGMNVSHVYFIDGVRLEDITVYEGQGYVIIHSREDLERFTFAQISKDILHKWFTEYTHKQL